MPAFIKQQTVEIFNPGEQLPDISGSLWLILNGVVKTFTETYEETAITLGFWGVQDVVGQSLSNVESYFIECITEVEAISVEEDRWDRLSAAILSHGKQTQKLIYIVRTARVDKRLWLLLKWLANKFGCVIEEGMLIDFRLTHQEMANLIGTTRITVTKMLNRFEQENLIYRHRKRIIVRR